MCCPGQGRGWFPKQVRLTGEFYIRKENYFKDPDAALCRVLVEARCLARGAAGPQDYLGLHIWISYNPADGRLSVQGVDSMVI